jgi:hypothetical protein
MTDYFQRDRAVPPDQARAVDPPNVAERLPEPEDVCAAEAVVEGETVSRTLITPPPSDTRSNNVSTGAGTAAAAARAPEEHRAVLFPSNEANDLRARWDRIQVGFVDEPRKAVEEANALVSDTMKRLTEIFHDQSQTLGKQWDRTEGVSTEDLRVALRRYRSFFARLLAI